MDEHIFPTKDEIEKLEEVVAAAEDLSLSRQKVLVEMLNTHIDKTDTRDKPSFWRDGVCASVIITPIWSLILFSGGLLDIEPIWFRFCLLPVLSVPAGVSYILLLKRKRVCRPDFLIYSLIIFFGGPAYGIVSGIILGSIIYFPLKWLGFVH
jgi:hypothetical protein